MRERSEGSSGEVSKCCCSLTASLDSAHALCCCTALYSESPRRRRMRKLSPRFAGEKRVDAVESSLRFARTRLACYTAIRAVQRRRSSKNCGGCRRPNERSKFGGAKLAGNTAHETSSGAGRHLASVPLSIATPSSTPNEPAAWGPLQCDREGFVGPARWRCCAAVSTTVRTGQGESMQYLWTLQAVMSVARECRADENGEEARRDGRGVRGSTERSIVTQSSAVKSEAIQLPAWRCERFAAESTLGQGDKATRETSRSALSLDFAPGRAAG